MAADLAQHQSRAAAGHGRRRDDFPVSGRSKRSAAARRTSSLVALTLAHRLEPIADPVLALVLPMSPVQTVTYETGTRRAPLAETQGFEPAQPKGAKKKPRGK